MTGPVTRPVESAPVDTAPPPRTAKLLRRRSRAAVARSARADRSLVIVLGIVLLAAGTLVALLSYGVFGTGRAARPLLDPVIVDTLRSDALVSRIVAIAAGVVLALIGLVWTARSLRPERRPDLVLEASPGTAIVVSSGAAADAVADAAAGLPGVGRARARLVGPESSPALRITVWLADDADVGAVLRGLDGQVLAAARASLGLPALPTAVRLELESPTNAPRVV